MQMYSYKLKIYKKPMFYTNIMRFHYHWRTQDQIKSKKQTFKESIIINLLFIHTILTLFLQYSRGDTEKFKLFLQ